jgi:hypothetical protein
VSQNEVRIRDYNNNPSNQYVRVNPKKKKNKNWDGFRKNKREVFHF